MEDVKNKIGEFSKNLGKDIAETLDVACAIESVCGESPTWTQLLQKYEVASLSVDSKSDEIKHSKATQGASLDEVYAVCQKIVEAAKEKLPQTITTLKEKKSKRKGEIKKALEIASQANDGEALKEAKADKKEYKEFKTKIESQYSQIERMLESLLEKTLKKYKAIVTPKKSMFGNVQKRAKDKMKAIPTKQKSGFVLKCNGCGAPRLSESDFKCGFCGTSFGA